MLKTVLILLHGDEMLKMALILHRGDERLKTLLHRGGKTRILGWLLLRDEGDLNF